MKRFLLLLLLGSLSLSAASCYSVELWSVKANNPEPLQTENGCKILDIGGYHANRCGCFLKYKEAKKSLLKYKKAYPHAYIAKTLKRRFVETPLKPSLKSSLKVALNYNPSKYFQLTDNLKELKYKKELQQNQTKIYNSYNDLSSFYGLSLEGKYEQYMNQNYVNRDYTDFEYELKLKFSLFKDGYFEHKKENKIEEKGAKILYFQNLSVILKNNFSDAELMIKGLQSEIDYNYFLSLASLYKNAMIQNENKLHSGTIQSYKYDEFRQKESRYLKSAKIYKRHTRVKIDKDIALMLDEMAVVKLKKIDYITKYSQENSYDLGLSRAKMDLLDVSKSYFDSVNMNVYLHRRKVDELGWYNTVGAEAKFPLDFSSNEESEMNKLQKNSYKVINKSLKNSIKKKIASYYLDFNDLQEFIKIDRDDVDFLKLRIQKFEDIQKNIVPNLTYDPEEEILLAREKSIELERNILLSKIELFKILNEIAYTGNIDDISYILEPKSEK